MKLAALVLSLLIASPFLWSAGTKTYVPIKAAVAPTYPPIAVAARVSGDVLVRVVIGPDGAVQQTEVVRGPKMLQQSAVDAASKWKYEPTNSTQVGRKSQIRFSYVLLTENDKEEPTTVFMPPDAVILKHRPLKPTVNYGNQSYPLD